MHVCKAFSLPFLSRLMCDREQKVECRKKVNLMFVGLIVMTFYKRDPYLSTQHVTNANYGRPKKSSEDENVQQELLAF